MALTQAESGILHVDDHHRHQYHHDEVYDVEHHSWPVSYDILRHKIERYKLRAEVGCRERVAHETRVGKGKRLRTGTKAGEEGGGGVCLNAASSSSAARRGVMVTGERSASQNTKAETQSVELPKVVYYPCRGPVSGHVCCKIHCQAERSRLSCKNLVI